MCGVGQNEKAEFTQRTSSKASRAVSRVLFLHGVCGKLVRYWKLDFSSLFLQ